MHPTNRFNASDSMSKLVSLQGSKTEEDEVVEESLRKPVLDEKEKVKGIEAEVVEFRRRRGGPPDLIYAKKSAPQSVLANAGVISDLNAVSYPEGVHAMAAPTTLAQVHEAVSCGLVPTMIILSRFDAS
jgi:predicted deacylase